jgi:hypothetical protein
MELITSPARALGRIVWPRRERVLPHADAASLGVASALLAGALVAPIVATAELSKEFAVVTAAIVAIPMFGRMAVGLALWRFIAAGTTLSGRTVLRRWVAAGLGLWVISLLPTEVGRWFPALAAPCLALVGAAGAVGYVVQADRLAACEKRREAAAEALRWELLARGLGLVGIGAGVFWLGWRWALFAPGLAMLAFGCWQRRRLTAEAKQILGGSVRAELYHHPRVGKGVRGIAVIYAAWELSNALPGLIGWGPLRVAALTGAPKLLAGTVIDTLGKVAEKRPARAVLWGAVAAASGIWVLAAAGPATLTGPYALWVIPGLGLALTDLGLNVAGADRKGDLAGVGVRPQLVAQFVRYLGGGAAGLAFTAIWVAPREILLALIATIALAGLAWDALRPPRGYPGGHVLTGDAAGSIKGGEPGTIDVVILARAPHGRGHWFCVRMGNGDEWAICGDLQRLEIDSPKGRRVLELKVRPRPSAALEHRAGTVPLGPTRGLPVADGSGDEAGVLVSRVDALIAASPQIRRWEELPEDLLGSLTTEEGQLEAHLEADVDPNGPVAIYELASMVLAEQKVRVRPVTTHPVPGA